MFDWSMYESNFKSRGASRRDHALNRKQRSLSSSIKNGLSYHSVVIDGCDQEVAVINTDNLDTKKIFSLPGEHLRHGGIVHWMDNYWIITEMDANDEVYTKAIMRQCNYLLKWVDVVSKSVVERWCLIEDGTKYLTGEYGDNDFVLKRGDSRIAMTVTKDDFSLRLCRESRFIIDDYNTPNPLAYRLTKPYKLGGSYGDDGVLRFVLSECNTEADDNLDLHIADYYTYFPRPDAGSSVDKSESSIMPGNTTSDGKKVWI